MKNRTLRKLRTLAILILILSATPHIYNKFCTDDMEIAMDFSYTVAENDTLWGIAESHNFNNGDIRKLIYDIKKFNGLADATIYEGQTLTIPIQMMVKDSEYQVSSMK